MLSLSLSAVALTSALLHTSLAQTYTDCNPLKTKGCPEMEALGGNATFNFNDTLYDKIWTKKNQGKVDWSDKGATFTVEQSGDSPQLISNFYMLFGRVEVVMKAAPGQGIISSAILQSEALDEIDWEFKGGDTTQVYTNYFGKGDMSDYNRGAEYKSDPPQDGFHNYTLDWTKDRIQWFLDGNMLRELKYDDAQGGTRYPQTPCNIRMGIWAGGDVKNNAQDVVTWAGGPTDFKQAPFSMTVQQVFAHDYTSAKTYSWDDMDASGSWEKVKVIQGKSETIQEIEKPSGVKDRFNGLSKTAKIAIVAGVLGFVALVALGVLFYCIKQRRAGRREFAAMRAQQDKEAAEELMYKGGPQPSGKFGYNQI